MGYVSIVGVGIKITESVRFMVSIRFGVKILKAGVLV